MAACRGLFFFLTTRPPPRSPLFPTRRSSDLTRRGPPMRRRSAAAARRQRRSPRRFSRAAHPTRQDRKSTRLNSSHVEISYAVFCLKKKNESGPIGCDRGLVIHRDRRDVLGER